MKIIHSKSSLIYLFMSFFLIGLLSINTANSAYNVNVHGTLIAEPCTLLPENEVIEVDFRSIIDKYLYINKVSLIETFSINLIDCDIGSGEGVKVRFIGNENLNLPGLLALDSESDATHIGIGIQNDTGKTIPINSETTLYLLSNGDNMLNFKAFVEAESDAIKNKTIGLGVFKATATFLLIYE